MSAWFNNNPMMPILLLIVLGISVFYNHPTHSPINNNKPTYIDTPQWFTFVISDIPLEKKKSIRYLVKTYPHDNIYLYLQKSNLARKLNVGDTINVFTTVKEGGKLGNFDYGRYLKLQHIQGFAYADSCHWFIENTSKKNILASRKIQRHLIDKYRSAGITGEPLDILSALTLGCREDLDNKTKASFQKAGAMHILAVSGLHTGIVYSVIISFLTLFGLLKPLYENRKHRTFNTIILISALMFYAWITGLSPSVVRSVIMLTLFQVAMLTRSLPNPLNIWASAAVINLILIPEDLFSVSFQLSYAAMLSIILFYPPLAKLRPSLIKAPLLIRYLVHYVFGILTVSLAAQIGTIPITLYYFNTVCNYFLITNLIVIPLAWILVAMGSCFFLFSFATTIDIALGKCLNALTIVLNKSVCWIEHLPHANTYLIMNIPMLCSLYGIIAFSFVSVKTKNIRWHGLTILSACLFLYNYVHV